MIEYNKYKQKINLGDTLDHVTDLGIDGTNEGSLSSVSRPVTNSNGLARFVDLNRNMFETFGDGSSRTGNCNDTAGGLDLN